MIVDLFDDFFEQATVSETCKNNFACLFSVHDRISSSRHKQVCLIRLCFKRYFSYHGANDDLMTGEVSLKT